MAGKTKEQVLRMAEARNVKLVRLWFADILGFLKSFSITVDELESALDEGKWFDGSSIEGLARLEESDLIAMPDPDTFAILPWPQQESGAVARIFCDILLPDGTPHDGDPRGALRRMLRKAQTELRSVLKPKAKGRSSGPDSRCNFHVGPEMEYFYFRSDKGKPEGLDRGGYFDLTARDVASDLRRETMLLLQEMGIPVECTHHEVAESQHEIDVRHTDAMTMADNLMSIKLAVKEVALAHGHYATFMPKPIAGQNGSGMHVHMSIMRDGQNLFYDEKNAFHLSDLARKFMAGLLRHVREFTVITNQWVNSYKRLVPGYEAPVYMSWGRKNRSALVRVPAYRPGKSQAARVELRSPDPACNPYLAFAVILGAGLKGVEGNYELPPPVEENVFEMHPDHMRERGIECLPDNLYAAIRAAEETPFVREALGDHLFEKFIANKKIEWDKYRIHVTHFELDRYLPIL
jgi:glutamine synthetase